MYYLCTVNLYHSILLSCTLLFFLGLLKLCDPYEAFACLRFFSVGVLMLSVIVAMIIILVIIGSVHRFSLLHDIIIWYVLND
ncbi:hypothetical protein RIF29_29316 [Crotalaria pallida]|uniref:Uncharacterized protein n=1 Tax=Crotalaria pallida TaxID=3830 RepID=A0AAN9EFA1_CROPI